MENKEHFCPICGEKLIPLDLGDGPEKLIESEILQMSHSYSKYQTSKTILDPKILMSMDLKDTDLYSYVMSASNQYAEALFLETICLRNIKMRLGLPLSKDIQVIDEVIYVHES